MNKKISTIILQNTKKLFKLLGFAKIEVKLEEKEGIFLLDVQTPDSAVLIGHHGENLASLQIILGLMVYHQVGSWQKINLNINNWRQLREEFLKKVALNLAQKAKFSGKAVEVSNLSASDRRIIHLFLIDNPDVVTCSQGEGIERHLVVKPKEQEVKSE